MAELSGSPLTKAIREMLRDPVVLARIREIYEEAEVTGHISPEKAREGLKVVEAIEREIAEDAAPDST